MSENDWNFKLEEEKKAPQKNEEVKPALTLSNKIRPLVLERRVKPQQEVYNEDDDGFKESLWSKFLRFITRR